jgi:hypothetical protein
VRGGGGWSSSNDSNIKKNLSRISDFSRTIIRSTQQQEEGGYDIMAP